MPVVIGDCKGMIDCFWVGVDWYLMIFTQWKQVLVPVDYRLGMRVYFLVEGEISNGRRLSD